jgi:hypothetical protein
MASQLVLRMTAHFDAQILFGATVRKICLRLIPTLRLRPMRHEILKSRPLQLVTLFRLAEVGVRKQTCLSLDPVNPFRG